MPPDHSPAPPGPLPADRLCRALIEQSPVAMLVQCGERICYANPAALRLLGATKAESLYALAIGNLFHPEDRQHLGEMTAPVSAADISGMSVVCRIRGLDGREHHVLASQQIVDYQGAPAWLISCQDFAPRKQEEFHLKNQTGFLQTLIDSIPLPIYYKDMSGAYSGCNRAFETASGLRREQLIGKRSDAVYQDESVNVHQAVDRELLSRGGKKVYEADFLFADGQLHRVIVHKAAFVDEHHRPVGLIGAMVDISDHLRIEQALQVSESNYRSLSMEFQAILEGIPNALTLWDQERRIIWSNENAKKFFLVDASKVIGKHWQQVWPLTHAEDECAIEVCFASGRQQEKISRAQNGRTWSLRAFPLQDEAAQVTKVLTLGTDITESLRLRDEAHRAAHLAALGELSAGIAHEINNPTGLILLNMPLIRDVLNDLLPLFDNKAQLPAAFRPGGLRPERLRDELPEVIEEVIDSARRIKHIVEDLKDFARVQDTTHFVEVDLNDVVAKSLRLLNNSIRKATDNFIVDYADNLPPVLGISQRLEQVIVNIVLNACQALTSRDECIAIAVYHEADKGVNRIYIWDEGAGIAPTVLAQVMDPFFTTKREQGGTGLGLSVSSRIMTEHHGHLYIDSPPGQGTFVTLELPVARQDSA